MKYGRAIYSWHKKKQKKTNAIAFAEKMWFISKKQLFPTTANPAFGFSSVSFFKAGCKLASLSRMAFPSILFMWRRLRYLLRVCSSLLGWNFAQQHTSWGSPVVWLNVSPNFWKTLAARDQKLWLSGLINYAKDFIIVYEVDEKFLNVESHSLMLVKWKKGTSPSHFLRNPTFGVISTTE